MRFVILTLAVLAGSCARVDPVTRPELPQSVASQWRLTGYAEIPPMPELNPTMNPPLCWRADYSGPGQVRVELCGYQVEILAFESFKRYPPRANALTFHHDRFFVRIEWTGSDALVIDPLVEAIRRSVPHRRRDQKSDG